ncbi:hypothetical protein [Allostreptomyces psammosilenae]|uniref:Uncharacterized protein n=1 Tax=Allostreptomyces psammosilenae TaxID=1892865 RepID=A0A852ZQ39_9ACTN|nr:hypothetical protein [Allostreptomyces psammosilenae]NYI03380.1 hypothetical protein [Allostreptomyces psammosilenae]
MANNTHPNERSTDENSRPAILYLAGPFTPEAFDAAEKTCEDYAAAHALHVASRVTDQDAAVRLPQRNGWSYVRWLLRIDYARTILTLDGCLGTPTELATLRTSLTRAHDATVISLPAPHSPKANGQ